MERRSERSHSPIVLFFLSIPDLRFWVISKTKDTFLIWITVEHLKVLLYMDSRALSFYKMIKIGLLRLSFGSGDRWE